MKQKLYLMIGTPGAGKSTYAKKHLKNERTFYVSRDAVRFYFVSEDEEYFSKETFVFNTFVSDIEAGLRQGYDVVADATHLTPKSRVKLLTALDYDPVTTEVLLIVVQPPLEECLKRNKNREGTRAFVPESVIRRMHNQFRYPDFNELLVDAIIDIDTTNDTVKKISFREE